MKGRFLTIALLALIGSAVPAFADVMAGALDISGAWARATPPGAPTGGGYLTIANHGATDDILLSASTSEAASTELHSMAIVNGVAQMRALTAGVPIPAGGTVTFDPNGMHVMFVQLKHQLEQGGSVPLTLTFKNAGTVTVDLPVLGIGSMGPPKSSAGSN
jgi:copper(I)-binding protein